MPWRDEIDTSAVTYSDVPKEDGPSPVVHDATGNVIEFTLSGGEMEFEAQFQFWAPKVDFQPKAPYIAWQIEDQYGKYGVFDGHQSRIWLGETAFVTDNRSFSFVNLSKEWRHKIHWEDVVDRIWFARRQYSHEQVGELQEVSSDDLVDVPNRSDLYRVRIETYWEEKGELLLQLWRPKRCQAVFIATEIEIAEIDLHRRGKKGVLDKVGIIPETSGEAIRLEESAIRTLLESGMDVRNEPLNGLDIL